MLGVFEEGIRYELLQDLTLVEQLGIDAFPLRFSLVCYGFGFGLPFLVLVDYGFLIYKVSAISHLRSSDQR